MKTNKDVLGSIMKTTQMGQIGIQSALNVSMNSELRQAMESQLNEYGNIESEASSIAKKKHWSLKQVHPSVQFMTDRITKLKLSYGNVNKKIASMMIRGNISGEIKGIKNLHQLANADNEIVTLANKLIDTENSNIEQMKSFL